VVVLDTRPEARQDGPVAHSSSRADTGEMGAGVEPGPPPEGQTGYVPGLAPGGSEALGRHEYEEAQAARRRPLARRLLVALVVIVVLAAAAYGAIRYWLANSWYVAAGDSGAVTIFQGVEGEVAGIALSHVKKESSLSLSQLPENLRSNVRNGIVADSLQDAHDKVANLKRQAREYEQLKRRERHRAKNGSGGSGR
jgi:protein phosphatase